MNPVTGTLQVPLQPEKSTIGTMTARGSFGSKVVGLSGLALIRAANPCEIGPSLTPVNVCRVSWMLIGPKNPFAITSRTPAPPLLLLPHKLIVPQFPAASGHGPFAFLPLASTRFSV